MRTISVLLHNKPITSVKTLSYVKTARFAERFKLFIYIDPGNTDEMVAIAKAFRPDGVIVFKERLTCYRAIRFVNKDLFEVQGSSWNVYVEDDTLIAPDALWYFTQVEPYLFSDENPSSSIATATLLSDVLSTGVKRISGFNSAWGTYWSRKFYFDHFVKIGGKLDEDRIYPYGWDVAVDAYMRYNGLHSIRSDLPRSKNIWWENASHNQDGLPDFGDHWTGGAYIPFYPINLGDLVRFGYARGN